MTKLLRRVESFLRHVAMSIACGVRTQLCTYPLMYATTIIIIVSVLMPGIVLMLIVLWLLFAAVNVLSNTVRR